MLDPNRAALETIARALGALREELVLVGGTAVGLLVTDPAAEEVRPTDDIDLTTEAASYADYQTRIAPELRAQGFMER